jgi:hypothetical protein
MTIPTNNRPRDGNVLDQLLDLEPQIRDLNHLAAIFTEWACNATFFDSDKTDEQRAREVDRLVFATCELRDKISVLHKAFTAAIDPTFTGPAKSTD